MLNQKLQKEIRKSKEKWQTKKIEDLFLVTDFVANGSFASLRKNVKYINHPDYAVLVRLKDYTKGWNDNYVYVSKASYDFLKKTSLFPGDLIMSNVGEPGRVFVAPNINRPMTLGPNSILIRPKSREILTTFLKYYFQSPHAQIQIKNISSGATQKKFNKTSFRSLPISIPTITVQKRIVKKLDAIFENIDKVKESTEKNLQNSKELFDSYLTDSFKKDEEKYQLRKFSEVCKYEKIQNKKDNLPYVGLEDIESNTGRFIGSLEPKKAKSNTFYFDKNEILYGRLRPYLNKVFLPDLEGHCSTEIFPIKTSNGINRNYLFYWFINKDTVRKINSTWTGTRMPRANMNQVLNFTIPLPPIKIQENVSYKFNKLSKQTKILEENYKQKLLLLDELKKSVLAKAFAGEL